MGAVVNVDRDSDDDDDGVIMLESVVGGVSEVGNKLCVLGA